MGILGFLTLLFSSNAISNSGYVEISRPNQSYPVMAKYDSAGILRYVGGKRNGKPVGGLKAIRR
jgi:hypothetical protein